VALQHRYNCDRRLHRVELILLKRALVLGGAANVFDDAERALALSEFEEVICVKRVVQVWSGQVDAFATLHPEHIVTSLQERTRRGYSAVKRIYCNVKTKHVDEVVGDWAGSSGLFGVRVALHRGNTHVVVCGVPIDASYHFDRPVDWEFYAPYRRGWARNEGSLRGTTRSMSGWTKTFLGAPSEEWLSGKDR
jgi:hypothetical protein